MPVRRKASLNKISKQRFDALGGYCKKPGTELLFRELDWFEYANERFIGVIVQCRTDLDFAGMMLAKDKRGRYRAADFSIFFDTKSEATKSLDEIFKAEEAKPISEHYQGDEIGVQVDLFSSICHNPNPNFHALATTKQFSPAKEIIKAMIYYFDDPDKNFVEQFQTTGFDSRIWELYLFAAFHEQGFTFDRSEPAPDYHLQGLGHELFVEAVTVNATMKDGKNIEEGLPVDKNLRENYMQNYIPIKYGSPLTSKLRKNYWEKPHVEGKPLLLAIQDFHYPGSMMWSEPYLIPYLYGKTFSPEILNKDGQSQSRLIDIHSHSWLGKSIESNFFALPNAENISAIITSPQGTLHKFNTMGCIAHFGKPTKNIVRIGTAIFKSEKGYKRQKFCEDVCGPDYFEKWSHGMNVYHNPRALYPLSPDAFPLALHRRVVGNKLEAVWPEFYVLQSGMSYGKPVEEVRASLNKIDARLRRQSI